MRLAKIKIDDKGNMTIDFIGFKGRQCDIAESNLLKLLELKIKKGGETYKKADQLMLEELQSE